MTTRKPIKKLGKINRSAKMSDFEKMFLSQQPFLQTYFNKCAEELAAKYKADGIPARIQITVIPTFAEKIYNIMTEIIPEDAKEEKDVLRITRYIRIAELLQARTIISMLSNGTEEEILANADKIKELLPDRLQHDFVNVKRTDENGEEQEVQLRVETVTAMHWLDNLCRALNVEYEKARSAQLVHADFNNVTEHIMVRLAYNPTTSEDIHVFVKNGFDGVPRSIKNLGPFDKFPLLDEATTFDELDDFVKSEVRRFLESNLNKTFGWEIVVVANANSKSAPIGKPVFHS